MCMGVRSVRISAPGELNPREGPKLSRTCLVIPTSEVLESERWDIRTDVEFVTAVATYCGRWASHILLCVDRLQPVWLGL